MSATTYTCHLHNWIGCLLPCPMCAMKATDPGGAFFDDPSDDIQLPNGPLSFVSKATADSLAAENAALVAERDEAIAEATRLREREAHFAKVLGVADGGKYRNDWDSRIAAVVAERDRLTREVEAARQRAHIIAGAVPATWRNGSMAQRAAYRALGEALREPSPEGHDA